MSLIARPGRRRAFDIWPGFVDILSSLLMVVIFVLMMFAVWQIYLNTALSGRDEALQRLNRQINELSQMLALEQQANEELRLTVAQLSSELQTSTAARDDLSSQLSQALAQRDTLAASLAQMTVRSESATTDADELQARLVDAYQIISADRETIEVQLRELESLRRDIEALRTVRAQLEAEVTQLAGALQQSQQDSAALEEQMTALRDRSQELEARLSTEAERTALAQREIEERDIRLSELLARATGAEEELDAERQVAAQAQAEIDVLNQQIAALREQLTRVMAALEVAEAEVEEQAVQIANLGQRLNLALAGRVEELQRYRSEFFGRLRAVLGERPDIRVVGDRFMFQSEVLFGAGSADIGPEGQNQLGQLAATLIGIADEIPEEIDWVLQVSGHTDRRPISTPQFPSNWELSTARAISVVRFLISQGLPPDRLAAAGYGEFQPIADGSTEADFRRNRRIELKLTQP